MDSLLVRDSKKRLNKIIQSIFVVIIGLWAMVLFACSITTYTVSGDSMSPTYIANDWVVVSKIASQFSVPSRGDLVVFRSPINENEQLLKRVIGLPYETVTLQNGILYINGEQLIEQYMTVACSEMNCDNRIWQLAENEYFLMGDNREISIDSRSFGAISREHIVGKVVFPS